MAGIYTSFAIWLSCTDADWSASQNKQAKAKVTMAHEVRNQDRQRLIIKVQDQWGEAVSFKVKPSTKFSAVYEAYSAKKGVTGYRFLFNGQRLEPNRTPSEEEMSNGDVIAAMIEQGGGARSSE